jgi:quinol monooxygenase YgiN
MLTKSVLARLEAKEGKEKELEAFLESALPLAHEECLMVNLFALKIGPKTYGIFNTFEDETGRTEHLNGKIAKALMDNAAELLATPPQLEMVDILGYK